MTYKSNKNAPSPLLVYKNINKMSLQVSKWSKLLHQQRLQNVAPFHLEEWCTREHLAFV